MSKKSPIQLAELSLALFNTGVATVPVAVSTPTVAVVSATVATAALATIVIPEKADAQANLPAGTTSLPGLVGTLYTGNNPPVADTTATPALDDCHTGCKIADIIKPDTTTPAPVNSGGAGGNGTGGTSTATATGTGTGTGTASIGDVAATGGSLTVASGAFQGSTATGGALSIASGGIAGGTGGTLAIAPGGVAGGAGGSATGGTLAIAPGGVAGGTGGSATGGTLAIAPGGVAGGTGGTGLGGSATGGSTGPVTATGGSTGPVSATGGTIAAGAVVATPTATASANGAPVTVNNNQTTKIPKNTPNVYGYVSSNGEVASIGFSIAGFGINGPLEMGNTQAMHTATNLIIAAPTLGTCSATFKTVARAERIQKHANHAIRMADEETPEDEKLVKADFCPQTGGDKPPADGQTDYPGNASSRNSNTLILMISGDSSGKPNGEYDGLGNCPKNDKGQIIVHIDKADGKYHCGLIATPGMAPR